MKKSLAFAGTLLALAALTALIGVHAFAGGGKSNLKADQLTGYQESAPVPISTQATGTFQATINDDDTISFTLTYIGLSAPATVAHIHFGNRVQNGGVVVFLCGGGGQGPCPPGTTDQATVNGTITPANVAGLPAQGIAPDGAGFQQLLDAMRAGVTYANVHDGTFPAGEIRGQINDDNQRQP
jgi:CHRD domain-containing protein